MFDCQEYEAASQAVGPLTVRVVQDSDGRHANPRGHDGNLGTFWTAHRNYSSPDDWTGESIWAALAERFDVRVRGERWRHSGQFVAREDREFETDPDTILAAMDKAGAEWLWVFLYDHSGLCYSAGTENPFSCRWDSGKVGVIFADRETLCKEYGPRLTKADRAKARAIMAAEVDLFDEWQRGDVWGYIVESPDGDTLESCWGFLGGWEGGDSVSYCLHEGVEAAESIIRRRAKARAARLKTLIRGKCPLHHRAALLDAVKWESN